MVNFVRLPVDDTSIGEPGAEATGRLEPAPAAGQPEIGSFNIPQMDSDCSDRVVRCGNNSILIVADGFGNESSEETVVVTIANWLERAFADAFPESLSINQLRTAIKQALTAANAAIVQKIRGHERKTAGCSVVVAVQVGQLVMVKSVGNCRAYLLKHDVLKQLTQDHTLTHLLKSSGQNTSQLRGNRREILLNFLGSHDFNANDEFARFELTSDARLLLTCRSLGTVLSDAEIRTMLDQANSAAEAATALGSAVADRGVTDVTCVTMFGT